MSEVQRLDLHRFISNFEKVKTDLKQLEFFAETRSGALLALQSSLPAPEHATLFAQVLQATEAEIKNPQIDKLKTSFSIIEHLIQEAKPSGKALDHHSIQEQLTISRTIINYYTQLYNDTKLVLTSAQFQARDLPSMKDISMPAIPAPVQNPSPLPSNVKRMDVHRAQEYLETFTKATNQLELVTTNMPKIFQDAVTEEHIASFPELAILTQGAIAERNNMIEAARILQKSIQQRINQLSQEPLPNPPTQTAPTSLTDAEKAPETDH